MEHIKEQIGASFDTDYRVIERCVPDCPVCAREATFKEFVEWLKRKHIWAEGIVLIPITDEEWQKILRGKMPEGKEEGTT